MICGSLRGDLRQISRLFTGPPMYDLEPVDFQNRNGATHDHVSQRIASKPYRFLQCKIGNCQYPILRVPPTSQLEPFRDPDPIVPRKRHGNLPAIHVAHYAHDNRKQAVALWRPHSTAGGLRVQEWYARPSLNASSRLPVHGNRKPKCEEGFRNAYRLDPVGSLTSAEALIRSEVRWKGFSGDWKPFGQLFSVSEKATVRSAGLDQ
jgi:hypothetical protein